MSIQIINDACGCANQLLVKQAQGENTPIAITLPYDITGFTFKGTINFPVQIALSLGSGITASTITSYTGAISGNILTVSAITSGTIFVGMLVAGVGILPNTYIAGIVSGTGGIGTYNVTIGQTVASQVIANSVIILQLLSSQTESIPEGQYVFELWTISPSMPPINTEIIKGFFEISTANTRIP
jgi:hypothetical protein